MFDQSNRRSDKRVVRREALSLTIIFTSQNPSLLGRTITGSTLDISASGLGLILDTELPTDSTIDLSIILTGDTKEFFLSGKVCWCREVEEGMYKIGIILNDLINTESDLKRWRKALK